MFNIIGKATPGKHEYTKEGRRYTGEVSKISNYLYRKYIQYKPIKWNKQPFKFLRDALPSVTITEDAVTEKEMNIIILAPGY